MTGNEQSLIKQHEPLIKVPNLNYVCELNHLILYMLEAGIT